VQAGAGVISALLRWLGRALILGLGNMRGPCMCGAKRCDGQVVGICSVHVVFGLGPVTSAQCVSQSVSNLWAACTFAQALDVRQEVSGVSSGFKHARFGLVTRRAGYEAHGSRNAPQRHELHGSTAHAASCMRTRSCCGTLGSTGAPVHANLHAACLRPSTRGCGCAREQARPILPRDGSAVRRAARAAARRRRGYARSILVIRNLVSGCRWPVLRR